jgi:hypothetical protein
MLLIVACPRCCRPPPLSLLLLPPPTPPLFPLPPITAAASALYLQVEQLQRMVTGRQVHHGWLLVKMGGVYFSDILLNR